MNFRAVLVLPKTAGSAKTHKSMSFIWIVWSTLYVYLWLRVHHTSLSCFCLSLLTLLLTIYWPTLPPSFLTLFSSIPHHHSQNYYYIHSICVNYLYKMEEKKEPLLLQQQREIDDDNVFWAKNSKWNLFIFFCTIFLYIILGWYHDNLRLGYCLFF